jgi:site-specific DNA recombinase
MTRRHAGCPSLAVGYLRASTDEQHLGPEAQRSAIIAWAERTGVTMAAWCSDIGVSGATPVDRRPGLLAGLTAIGEHDAGVLVAAKRDRLARDVMVAAAIERIVERAGARVVTADGVGLGDGPEAALLRAMVDAFAAYERALIRARTRAALGAKRERGENLGTPPIGFRLADDRVHLEPDPTEAIAVARVLELHSAGWSVRRIATELDREGVPCRGRRWHRQSVWRVLRARAVTTATGS